MFVPHRYAQNDAVSEHHGGISRQRLKKQTRVFTGHVAQIIQHEIDHTNGILI
ncbi:MAG: peptide deformylase [Pyramidobacter sp.]|nr:peptide deformylase [Pyramidobacter sp.]